MIYLGRVLYDSANNGQWKSQSLINIKNFKNSSLSDEVFAGIILRHFITLNDEPSFDHEKSHHAIKTFNMVDNNLIQYVYNIIFNFHDNKKEENEWTFGNNSLTHF